MARTAFILHAGSQDEKSDDADDAGPRDKSVLSTWTGMRLVLRSQSTQREDEDKLPLA